jgi:hypothetical protein
LAALIFVVLVVHLHCVVVLGLDDRRPVAPLKFVRVIVLALERVCEKVAIETDLIVILVTGLAVSRGDLASMGANKH